MITLIVFLFLGTLIYFLIKYKISIDIQSFFKKGFQARRGKFGVYCFCGKQGSGKTFSTVNFITKHLEMPIYSNIHLKDIDYIYYNGFEELLKIDDHHCIIVFDEIFTALTKQTRMSQEVLAFLSQMRKKNVIFITTAQEWLEINITLRRYVRYQIDCQILNILPFSILIEHYRDGEQMKWSNLDNDYVAPIVATKISKMMLKITTHYDTWEVISNKPQKATLIMQPKPKLIEPESTSVIKDSGDRRNVAGVAAHEMPLPPATKSEKPERAQSLPDSSASRFWQIVARQKK